MSTVLISGATGLVGWPVTEHFLARGDDVIVMGRRWPAPDMFSEPVEWVHGDLDPDHDFSPAFDGVDIFVHCAFSHQPGRYRGGEGDDPDGFMRANVDGTIALMEAARRAGVARTVFVSSRAVYGPGEPGAIVDETTPCCPDTLYGVTKLDVETRLGDLASSSFVPIVVRVTGVYGPAPSGCRHKWSGLFANFEAGLHIEPRIGTEVHGADLAAAISLLAYAPHDVLAVYGMPAVFNVSDIALDRAELLHSYARAKGFSPEVLPPRADFEGLSIMDCARLRALGWRPRGMLDLSGMI